MEAPEIARICNDEIAEMVAGNPKRYSGHRERAANNVAIAMKEAERAITQLDLKESRSTRGSTGSRRAPRR